MTCDKLEREGLLRRLGEQMDPHVHECGDCHVRLNEYARLVAALAQESTHALPGAWKERTLARIRARQMERRRRVAIASGLAVAGALAAILVIYLCIRGKGPGAGPLLALRMEAGAQTWRGPAHPGGRLIASGKAGSNEWFEVRIYLDERTLLVRCPSMPPPTCRVLDGAVEVTWKVLTRGEYQAILLVSSSPLPAATGNLDADVRAAGRSGARVAGSESIEIY